jgi:hypothetical protein
MAYNETYTITELDPSLLEPHIEKLHFFFGHKDPYTPLDLHYEELKRRFPARMHSRLFPKLLYAFCGRPSHLLLPSTSRVGSRPKHTTRFRCRPF